MEKTLEDLLTITKQKILLDPDVVIAGKLLNFEQSLPDQSKLSDELFEKIEKVIIRTLYSNNSQISFQCSIRIAECLLSLYQGKRQMKIWNLITSLNKSPEVPIIIAAGHVLNKVGKYSKSLISGVAKTLFGLPEKMTFAQLFALCSCFKSSPKDMMPYVEKSLTIIKKFILLSNEPVQIQCLKLSIRMAKNHQLAADKMIPLITQLLTDQFMPFIIDESCYLIARLAFSQIRKTTSKSASKKGAILSTSTTTAAATATPSSSISTASNISPSSASMSTISSSSNDSQISKAFNIIETFRKYFKEIFPRFLSLLSPEFINQQCKDELFAFVRRIDSSEMAGLVSLFGIDVRREMFTQISKENPSLDQLSLLNVLSFDSNSFNDTASLALELATRPNQRERSKSCQFFADFVKKDPESASHFLKKATKFLSSPPKENSQTIEQDMKGLSSIVATILSASPNREQLIQHVEENINSFLQEAYKIENITDPRYLPLFTVLSALPSRFVQKESIDVLLSLYPKFLKSYQGLNEKDKKFAQTVADTLSLFLSVHQDIEKAVQIIDVICSNEYLQSDYTQLCVFLAYPTLKANGVERAKLATRLKAIVMKGKTNQDYISALVKNPFITRTMFLNNIEFVMPELPAYFASAHSSDVMYRTFQCFPEFITSLPESSKPVWIKWLVVDCASKPMAHCLIYSLINDHRTQKLLPANLHDVVLSVISSFDRTDYTQMAAEVIACWAKIFPKIVPKILETLASKQDRAECLTLAALFAHIPMNDDMISNQMIELNNIAKKNADLCPFALFALSSLFLSYPAQLAAMPYVDSQANFLFSLLCTPSSLDSFNLLHIARAFNALLPIISPDIERSRPLAIPILKMTVQLISMTPLPFCEQIFFHTMHSVFSFVKFIDFEKDEIVKMSFPNSAGVNLSCQIEACQAFADMLVVNNYRFADFMDLIPQILRLLQRTNHNFANMFIIAVAANFVTTNDPKSPSCRDLVLRWTNIIKQCVSAGSLPANGNVKIGANDKVKACMLKAAQEIIAFVLKTDPLINEALDDLMTSLTRAVESKTPELQKIAYPLMQKVILELGNVKGEGGQPIICLYDIMFASAVKVGFFNLDISGDFVLSFLNFHIENIDNSYDEFVSILDYFISGFKACDHKTWHYHAIAARLCEISSNNVEIYEKIESFLPKFVNDFAKIIMKAAEIWNEEPPNEIEITKFKIEYSSVFCELLTSFICLQSKLELSIIKPKLMFTFLFDELSSSNESEKHESWRINTAFRALSAVLEYESSHITSRMLAKAIDVASHCYEQWNTIVLPSIPKFLRIASEMLEENKNDSWQNLVSILVDDNFDSTVLCYLIKNGGNETISQYAINFVELIYTNFMSGKCDLISANSLSTMIFYIADDKLEDLLDYALSIKDRKRKRDYDRSVEFKFSYLSQLFKFLPSKSKRRVSKKFGERISSFIWNNFLKGGQTFVVQLICENSIVAKAVMLSDDSIDYGVSIVEDIEAIYSYFEFIKFVLLNFEEFHNNDDFLNIIIKFCLRLIIQWGDDNKKGKNVILQSAQVLKIISNNSEPLIRIAFKEMDEEFQGTAILYMKQFTKKIRPNKKGANIQLFGKSNRNQRKTKKGGEDDDDGEWQDLIVED